MSCNQLNAHNFQNPEMKILELHLRKEYFLKLLEGGLLHQIFVY